jgi:hypothetical protein
VSKITNIKILGLALFAVFALSAVTAASALAESEWLWKGLAIPAGQELATDTETVETLTLDVLNEAASQINEILCSGLFEGGVLPGGVDLITDVWTLPPSQQLVEVLEPSPGVEGKSLSCEITSDTGGCETGTTAALVWVDELSLASGATWETLVELDSGTIFLDHFHNVAFELLCFLLEPAGVDLEALCGGLTSAVLANEAEGVLITFNDESEALGCTTLVGGGPGPAISSHILGKFDIFASGGGALAVS